MCLACVTTLAVIVTGSTSVGGLTVFVVKKLCTLTVRLAIEIPYPS